LRERALYDDYLAKLDPKWRSTVTESIAGVWIPIEAGVAHYAACNALTLTTAQHINIGREVGERVHGTLLGMLVRTARSAGVTPWTALAQGPRLYPRLFDGGGICIVKSGPKDAKWELVENPIVRFAWFRDGARGMWESAIELFCEKAYVVELGRTETSVKLGISWA
jgi:hypothetical protein